MDGKKYSKTYFISLVILVLSCLAFLYYISDTRVTSGVSPIPKLVGLLTGGKAEHPEETPPEFRNKSVVLAVASCGSENGKLLLTLLKSILMFTHLPFHVIVISDKSSREFLAEHLKRLLPNYVSHEFRAASFPQGYQQPNWEDMFKRCSTERLFLPSIIWDHDAVIYVDTDSLFLAPIEDLWSYFNSMKEEQLIGVVIQHEPGSEGAWYTWGALPAYKERGLNAGVLLMNLTRMRQSNWESQMLPTYLKYKPHIGLADQDILNAYLHFHPELVMEIPCIWNYRRTHCDHLKNQCKEAAKDGAALLHGNKQVFFTTEHPAFKKVYDALRTFDAQDPQSWTAVTPNPKSKQKLSYAIQKALKAIPETICNSVPEVFFKRIAGSYPSNSQPVIVRT